MIKLTEEINRMRNAQAFADAGEYLTPRRKTGKTQKPMPNLPGESPCLA